MYQWKQKYIAFLFEDIKINFISHLISIDHLNLANIWKMMVRTKSNGRGSDIIVPMAISSFGGMVIAMITTFMVSVLYLWIK